MRARLWRSIVDARFLLAALLLAGTLVWHQRGTGSRAPITPEHTSTQEEPVTHGPAAPRPAPSVVLVPKRGGSARAPVARTDHLVLYTSTGSYGGGQVAGLAAELETALAYVEERTAMHLGRPVSIMFDRRPEACGLDAVAYTHVRTLVIYVCPEVPGRRVVNVLAHELVHQLAHDDTGPAHLQADLILSEGLATWGAGRYWLGGAQDFRAFVVSNYRDTLLPLDSVPRGDDSAARLNQLYYQWAAFVEWIMAEHGPDAFKQLYATGTGRHPGSAQYETVLGLSLAQAEERWINWIAQAPPP